MRKLTLKQHWRIANGLMFAGVIVMALEIYVTKFSSVNWWMLGTAVVLVTVGYIYHLKFVRCPECGARLPSRTKFPEQCDACGQSLAKYNK